jgi:RNA polymerase sigma-70 factor, ECF subfamily
MTSSESDSPEREWVLRARRGDVDAFNRLIDLYDRRLLYFILRFVPDGETALDVLQDVWLILFRRLPRLRAPEAFRVWLYQVAHDRVIDLLRRRRREAQAHEVLRNGLVDYEDGPEERLEQVELVHHALDRLSPEHREVLLLRFLEGLSLEETAATLRLPQGTVKSRLHYARLALRRQVETIDHDGEAFPR